MTLFIIIYVDYCILTVVLCDFLFGLRTLPEVLLHFVIYFELQALIALPYVFCFFSLCAPLEQRCDGLRLFDELVFDRWNPL